MNAQLVEIDDGWDFKVLVLDDAWVVRWPRHRLAVEEIEKEVELLPVLAPLLPVDVPRFEYVSRDPWLVVYRLIRGTPLVAEDPEGVQPEDRHDGPVAGLPVVLGQPVAARQR